MDCVPILRIQKGVKPDATSSDIALAPFSKYWEEVFTSPSFPHLADEHAPPAKLAGGIGEILQAEVASRVQTGSSPHASAPVASRNPTGAYQIIYALKTLAPLAG